MILPNEVLDNQNEHVLLRTNQLSELIIQFPLNHYNMFQLQS
jgi:hypothetical protein